MSKRLKTVNPYFLLTTIILTSCSVVYFDFIFGNNYFMFGDIGSDTKTQYVMWYSSIADKLRAGTFSFWDFKNGFGANISMEGIYDPFQFIICIFGAVFGSSFIPHVLIYVNVLKITLAGLFMFYFLSCFQFSKKSKIILSYMYAFNGFMIVWGQHYSFATVVVFLPILFAGVEKTLYHKYSWILLAFSTFLIGICSLYFCYMSLITAGIYYVVRLIQISQPMKTRVKIFFKESFSIILGLGLACFALLPAAYIILKVSPRISTDTSLWSRLLSGLTAFPKEHYTMLFYRMFSSNLQGTINYKGFLNYYEALNFCCSNLLIFLLIQHVFFIFKKSVPKKEQVIQCMIIALLAFAFLLPMAGIIYNGFCYSANRWTFAVIPVLILLSAKALDKIIITKKLSLTGVFIYLILISVAYGKAHRNFNALEEGILKLNAVILFLTGCMIVLGIYVYKKGKFSSQALCFVLLSAVCINLVADSYVSANYRDAIKKDGTYISDVHNQDVKDAVCYLKQREDSFFRMEKTYISGINNMLDPLVQNYYGVNTYNSIINKDVLKFNENIWKNIQAGIFSLQCFNNAKQDYLMASLVDLKYILTNNPDEKIEGFTKYKDFGSITVLKNDHNVALGRLYTKSITEQQFEGDEFNLDNLLADAVILEKESQYTASPSDLENYKSENKSEDLLNRFHNQELADFKVSRTDSRLVGKINASQNGILFLSVPYEAGWEVYVDGNHVEKLKANYGFTGINITSGQHDIKLIFTPPMFNSGIIVSTLSLLILVVIVLYQKKRERSCGIK